MINLAELGRVFIVYGKTDMRRGIDSLAYIVKKSFNLAPFSGCVFLFCGSRRNRFKALYWDGQGFWLLYKRFENGKLAWPNNEDEVRELSDEQVMRLMQGFTIDPKINTARARELYWFHELFWYSHDYESRRDNNHDRKRNLSFNRNA